MIVSLDIPDIHMPELLDSVAANNRYQENIPDPDWIDPEDGSDRPLITNPTSKAKFARLWLYERLREQILIRRKAEKEAIKQSGVAQDKLDVADINEV